MRDSFLAPARPQSPSVQVIEPSRPVLQQPQSHSPSTPSNESTRLIRNNFSVPAFRAYQNSSVPTPPRPDPNNSIIYYENPYSEAPPTQAFQSLVYEGHFIIIILFCKELM